MKLNSLTKLSLDQWLWLAEAFVRLIGMRARIRFSSPAWLNKKIGLASAIIGNPSGASVASDKKPDRMFESVRLAARLHPGKAECLPRSLVLASMLKRRGYDARVKIGVARHEQNLASHAWVEYQGVIVGEPESVGADFTRLKL